jgi:hypothetical protein
MITEAPSAYAMSFTKARFLVPIAAEEFKVCGCAEPKLATNPNVETWGAGGYIVGIKCMTCGAHADFLVQAQVLPAPHARVVPDLVSAKATTQA